MPIAVNSSSVHRDCLSLPHRPRAHIEFHNNVHRDRERAEPLPANDRRGLQEGDCDFYWSAVVWETRSGGK
ncbi:hypothetical protein [Corynebacterium kroppenstedtii]|uniref:Uncharacterized protein n=1 Tax=Corynebacterium kroppenstedtii TaxID=161879 RepID=A0A2W5SU73_9CORY|nr:hypothetical protein [Corynebacterium kroppenstedtii]MDU7286011.1 hypothetical protein [Corynebacterium kroppenstedtii]PZR06420.1 MAG: hypothetical protein DI525_01195 [Corynebacterium kroppenstedtii]